jgi:hypothetical protein
MEMTVKRSRVFASSCTVLDGAHPALGAASNSHSSSALVASLFGRVSQVTALGLLRCPFPSYAFASLGLGPPPATPSLLASRVSRAILPPCWERRRLSAEEAVQVLSCRTSTFAGSPAASSRRPISLRRSSRPPLSAPAVQPARFAQSLSNGDLVVSFEGECVARRSLDTPRHLYLLLAGAPC